MSTQPWVFDGHNDALARSIEHARFRFSDGEDAYHLDLPRAREGGFGAGLFALFIPPDQREQRRTRRTGTGERVPATVPLRRAQEMTLRMFSRLLRWQEECDGAFRIARSVSEIEAARSAGAIAAVPHLEGAEPIDRDLEALDLYYQAGLRSLGIVWSRPNRFGHGVPLQHRHSPDTGAGLTRAGKRLVKRCNELGIMVDLSHLNERGFWDVAEISRAPLVASHSNAWALSPSTRNLTDRQLDAIRESDGLVGVNFGVLFLREDGARNEETPMQRIVEHVSYLAERVGTERVAFGSDFDGTIVPKELGDVRGLPRLVDALREAGFSDDELHGIAWANWMRVLGRTWGEG
jgi:membrane dipeptidase